MNYIYTYHTHTHTHTHTGWVLSSGLRSQCDAAGDVAYSWKLPALSCAESLCGKPFLQSGQ